MSVVGSNSQMVLYDIDGTPIATLDPVFVMRDSDGVVDEIGYRVPIELHSVNVTGTLSEEQVQRIASCFDVPLVLMNSRGEQIAEIIVDELFESVDAAEGKTIDELIDNIDEFLAGYKKERNASSDD